MILRSRKVCIQDKSYVLEDNGRDSNPKTDFKDPLYPVITIVFLILIELLKHEASENYQERKQPAINAFSGGVVLIVILDIQVKFKLNIASIPICDYLLGAVP